MKAIKLSFLLFLLTSLMTCTTQPPQTGVEKPVKPVVSQPTVSQPIATQPTTQRPSPVPYVRYNKNGFASWYRLSDHGLKTSSGEVYDLYGKTAAHPSLPLGSRVQITNLDNGKTAVVTINDRVAENGSLVRVSYIVAKQLQLLGRSQQQINVTTLPPIK